MRKSLQERESWRLEERRKEGRFTLILRVAVMEQYGRSSLCIVKNISPSGIQVKLYIGAIVDAPVSIRVADELPVHGHLCWVAKDTAGISFDQELDPTALLRVRQKLRPHRRRTLPRIAVGASATLRTGGRTRRARVCDISSVGARVRTRCSLIAGDRAMITLDGLPTMNAFVRWSDGEEFGLAFGTSHPDADHCELDRRSNSPECLTSRAATHEP